MSEVIYSILFFVLIFSFLTYSCQWFGRTLRRYQEARREFEEEQIRQQQVTQNPPGYAVSVYTVENGRRTLINYHTDLPTRSPAHIAVKEELPPTYEDALKLPNQSTNTTVIAVTNTNRRTSI